MIELIVGILGAGTFLVIYNFFLKSYVENRQKSTDKKIAKIEQKVEDIKQENTQIDQETNRQVGELENEKDKPVTSSDLVDFFNNRKS